MTLDASGNLLVGTTTSPSGSNVIVVGSSSTTQTAPIQLRGSGAQNIEMFYAGSGLTTWHTGVNTSNQFYIGQDSNAYKVIVDASTGALLIADTSNRSSQVVINAPVTVNPLYLNTQTGYNSGIQFAENNSIKWQIQSLSSGAGFRFYDNVAGAERARIDSSGNVQVQAGAVMPYAPAPASISTTATLTNANIQSQIINTTGTTYTVTMPLGTTLETLATWATTNVAYDFYVINTASGTITFAVNTGVTSLGTLTVATGVSAQFRIRRTAANTFVLYRLG
jgi:hypothetical protein